MVVEKYEKNVTQMHNESGLHHFATTQMLLSDIVHSVIFIFLAEIF